MTARGCVVVIPTYNEAATIALTVQQVLERPFAARVLVVDDNSPDGTGRIADSLAAVYPARVRVLHRECKAGLGRAYVAGFAAALADGDPTMVVQMDADGSHDPAELDRLVSALANHDLVIGSRYVPGGSTEGLSRPRELLSRGGNGYARMVLGTGVRDLTGGFKAWRASLLRRIDVGTVAADGYAFQIELTVRAARRRARITELPITFRERRAGTSKMNWRIAAEAVALVPWMATRNSSHHNGRHDTSEGRDLADIDYPL